MYSVSLLPYEYKLLNTKARKKNVNLLFAVVVMGVLFVVYMILTILLTGNNTKLNEIREETYALEAQIPEIDDLLTINNDFNSLLKDASLAAGSNPEWSNLITGIGNSVPETLNLTAIEMKYSESAGQCKIKGSGYTHQSVSELIQRLDEVGGIGEIKVSISTAEVQSDIATINFELLFPLEKGPGYQLPMEVTGNE